MTDGRESAYPCNYELDSEGLTKRELFAAMAMQALIAKIPLFDREGEHGIHTPTIEEIHGIRKQVAQSATDYADALIEALNEGKEQP